MNKNNKTNNGNENHGSHCQQMSDGAFDFVPRTKPKSRSVLIRKLAHGRRSRTQDDALQLTLKFFPHGERGHRPCHHGRGAGRHRRPAQ